jgi:hypothetical protein
MKNQLTILLISILVLSMIEYSTQSPSNGDEIVPVSRTRVFPRRKAPWFQAVAVQPNGAFEKISLDKYKG